MKQIFSYFLLIVCLFPLSLVGQEEFRVGAIRYKSQEAFMDSYQPLMSYLSKELGKKLVLDIVPEDELAFAMAKGKYDMGIFTQFPYIRAKIDFPELEVFASHTVDGEDSYSGCIMIRKESGINSLHELKERNFLFVKPTSTSGYKYPKGIFTERNLDVDAGFFSYDFSGGHDRSLEALNKNLVDGIAVDTRVYDQMNEAEKGEYHMLECYEIPYHAYVLSPEIDSVLKQNIKQLMFDAHKDPGNKKLFDNPLHIEKWHAQSDDAYNSLRRYLRIVRVKPNLHLNWEIRKTAQKMLDERGDLLDHLKESSLNKLMSTNRFKEVVQGSAVAENSRDIKITLGVIDGHIHYNFYLDSEQIGEGSLDEKSLVAELSSKLAGDVLNALSIETQLLYNGKEWFVTFGSDDGIGKEDYHFEVEGGSGQKKLLTAANISQITSLNTIFTVGEDFVFKEGQKVRILFTGNTSQQALNAGRKSIMSSEFWDQLDNIWGVIGLLVAFITVAATSYFSTRRKRRFQSLLRKSNDMLMHYLRDNEEIEAFLLSQKEGIHRSLEKGKINENQFLILNKRVEDIDKIIHESFPRHKKLDKSIVDELTKICSNGEITEKEFSRILILARKQQGLEANT